MTHHRVTLDWMGKEGETLEDLIPSWARAICIGINPAPRSVRAGHYYQGQQGQNFFARLRQAGVISAPSGGFEDDAAMAEGIGFTDVVKRPTASAGLVTRIELDHGASLLERKLNAIDAPVLIFPFKAAAVALVGRFEGNGWLHQRFGGSRLFVMPGPYESKATAVATIASLQRELR